MRGLVCSREKTVYSEEKRRLIRGRRRFIRGRKGGLSEIGMSLSLNYTMYLEATNLNLL